MLPRRLLLQTRPHAPLAQRKGLVAFTLVRGAGRPYSQVEGDAALDDARAPHPPRVVALDIPEAWCAEHLARFAQDLRGVSGVQYVELA